MTSRLPTSSKPPQQPAQQPQKAVRSTRPQATSSTPKLIKPEPEEQSTAAKLWSGQDYDKSLEIRAADIEAKMGEIAQSEQADKEEGAEHLADQRDKAEKEQKGAFKVWSWSKPSKPADPKALKQPQTTPQQQQAGTGKTPAFKPGTASSMAAPQKLATTGNAKLTGVSSSNLQAVSANKLAGEMARFERPPDAFALLRDAKEKGILFTEDLLQDGHREEDEDPELAEAVEECIRLCFGVLGILRIGPGHNDKNEPIIVIATTNGFSEASLAKVPEKVHRFPTLIAIPFDLLPLRRER